MPIPGSRPTMRAPRAGVKAMPWFRIENAHVDDSGSDVTKVYIYDVIGESWWSEDATPAADFIKQLSNIKTGTIELHLNSPGGDIFDGVAIYNGLKSHPARVVVIVDSLAASAASFIAQAGDEIIMTEAATMMIHDGSGAAYGFASDLRKTADILDKLSNTVANIYAGRSGQNQEFWRTLMLEETWYNAEEAVSAGLADKVQGPTPEDAGAAQNSWLQFFNHAGRGAAPDPLAVRQRIVNRLEEMTVARPQNQGTEGTQEPVEEPTTPEAAPEAEPAVVPEEEETTTAPAPVSPTNTLEPKNIATPFVFKVNGVDTSDPRVVQNRLDSLETFRNETLSNARVAFVEGLASDNKITQPQVEKLTKYALGLSEDGYAAWSATYEDAPVIPMLASRVPGTTNHSGPQSQAVEEAADAIVVCKEIIDSHKRSGLSNEKIMLTDSYKKLVTLDPTFKL